MMMMMMMMMLMMMTLVQNGPGKFSFGSAVFRHLFDGSALVRKFNIADGEVSYQCQFVKTESYKVCVQGGLILEKSSVILSSEKL